MFRLTFKEVPMTKVVFSLFFMLSCYLQGETLSSCLEMEITFEKANLKDREFLVDFAVQSNDIYQTRVVSEQTAQEIFDIPEIVFKKGIVEVLKCRKEIVGFYTLKPSEISDEWFENELGHLFVKRGEQNRGFGSLLFNRVVQVASQKGWKKLEWFSDPDAKTFYLKQGAVITGSCENLLNPEVNLFIFEYAL